MPATASMYYTPLESLQSEFCSRGLALLSPESLGVPASVHQSVYSQEMERWKNGEAITPTSVPAILDLLQAPGLIAAIDQLLGEGWAVVPFTHNAPFCSGGFDQQWHKDDNGPYNARKMRHHQSVQMEMIYYPQDVTPEMGPTACIPYAHYWTFDHEENNDNFAGADHLDFDYLLSGMERIPVNGPDAPYSSEDINNRNTKHDIRMRDAVKNTGWPLVQPMEAAPVRAGSVLLYSHNTFHRGNHRRDHWDNWKSNPRFMWRFYLYRVSEAAATSVINPDLPWSKPLYDALTETALPINDENLTAMWRYHYHWLQNGRCPPPRTECTALSSSERHAEAQRLYRQLFSKDKKGEALRIGAAYQLASIGDNALACALLEQALVSGRENVRRAATYGLVAVGQDARDTLLQAAASPEKWVRKNALFALGDACQLDIEILTCLREHLLNDYSVYVRSVCAASLGCLGRRAIAHGHGRDLVPELVAALLSSLHQEDNRISMNIAQGRSIKFVRPTDDCDVCEGDGIDFGIERFERVRSNPRENALWSLVMLSSHGAAVIGEELNALISTLTEIVRSDKNVISVGFAMDALNRLAHRHLDEQHPAITQLRLDLAALLDEVPIISAEAMVRSGTDLVHTFKVPVQER